MALVKCPECNREISDLAHHCPGCGAPANGYVAPRQQSVPVVIGREKKSEGTAIILALLFGPLGLLYITPGQALFGTLVALVLGPFTFGIVPVLIWICSILAAGSSVRAYNKAIDRELEALRPQAETQSSFINLRVSEIEEEANEPVNWVAIVGLGLGTIFAVVVVLLLIK